MAVFRVEKNSDYTVMSNHHLRNNDLSLRAKGLLSQILSLPDNWDYTIAGLAAINKEGKDAIRVAVQELEKAGYIERRQTMGADGKFSSNEYVVHEYPVSVPPLSDFPTTVLPTTEKPSTETPLTENPTELNKDISSKDKSIKKNKKERVSPLTDEQLQTLFIGWIKEVSADDWTNKARNEVYLALIGFYAPRASKKQEPARTQAAFTALSNRLVRYSEKSPTVIIDMLERATTAGWKSVFPLNGTPEKKQSNEGMKRTWI